MSPATDLQIGDSSWLTWENNPGSTGAELYDATRVQLIYNNVIYSLNKIIYFSLNKFIKKNYE